MRQIRDLMTSPVHVIDPNTSLAAAARRMRDENVGSLPVGEGEELLGMITDRDIVVRCVAEGKDPDDVQVSEYAEGKPVTVGADDAVEEILRTMTEHGVRRLPVIDGQQLVGMVSQADVAKNLPEDRVGDLVEAISSARPNN